MRRYADKYGLLTLRVGIVKTVDVRDREHASFVKHAIYDGGKYYRKIGVTANRFSARYDEVENVVRYYIQAPPGAHRAELQRLRNPFRDKSQDSRE
jgi:hypothetical protein